MLLKLGIICLSAMFSANLLALDYKYTEQINFEKMMGKTCFKKQRSERENNALEDWQVEQYCDCSARKTYNLLTQSDLNYLIKRNNFSESAMIKITAAANDCMLDLVESWH